MLERYYVLISWQCSESCEIALFLTSTHWRTYLHSVSLRKLLECFSCRVISELSLCNFCIGFCCHSVVVCWTVFLLRRLNIKHVIRFLYFQHVCCRNCGPFQLSVCAFAVSGNFFYSILPEFLSSYAPLTLAKYQQINLMNYNRPAIECLSHCAGADLGILERGAR